VLRKAGFVLPNYAGKIIKCVGGADQRFYQILYLTMSTKNKKSNAEVVKMLQEAVDTGNEAWAAVNKFHGKFLEASAAAKMLPEIRAPFDHICQGK